jgi:eukaryotic-like serine/threonine-protein kinase
MPLATGTRLGSYEMLGTLGAGGMGEVYRARDMKLNRDVAIKVLPDLFATDSDRLARFTREARTLAALNHPNIAIIHGLEEAAGVRALVMELVEGEDLSQRIARGAIPLDEALPIAKQIAEALEAAHEQGIIHRDLKPANIKLRPDGTVKVLDFGLAKAMEPAGDHGPAEAGHYVLSQSPTITTPAMTLAGVILGTAAYMSPEQAKGKPVDKRADIWAFGCVLYEMLAARRAFEAEDVSETLAAVLMKEPDWTALPAATPAAVMIVLRRCLQKDRKRRVRDIGDVSLALDGAFEAPVSQVPVVAVKPTWRRGLAFAGLAALAGALLTAGTWGLSRATPQLPVTRFTIAMPEGKSLAQTSRQNLALSPDGTRIVYSSDSRLFSRSLGEFEARALPGTEGDLNISSPAFSPDGRSVAYFSDRMLKRVGLDGAAPVPLCPADSPSGLTWDSTGILYGQGAKGIFRCPVIGSGAQQVLKLADGEEVHGPQLLPGTNALLFTVGLTRDGAEKWKGSTVVVESLSSHERTTLVRGGTDARYLPTGHLVYASSGTILAARFDPRDLSTLGEGVPVVQGVQMPLGPFGIAHFMTSEAGTLLYLPGQSGVGLTGDRIIAAADRAGAVERFLPSAGRYTHVRASRDGRFLALGSDDTRDAFVSIFPLDGTSSVRRLTFEGKNRFPIWSPDGARVAFQSEREGDLGIFAQRADGTGTTERLTRPAKGEAHAPESWSRDGKTLLFTAQQGATFSLWSLTIENGKPGRAAPVGDVQSSEPIDPVFSPDGRSIAYRVRMDALTGVPVMPILDSRTGVYVQPFPPTGARHQAPKMSVDFHPVWTPDGDSLVYMPSTNAGQMAIVRVVRDRGVSFGVPTTIPAMVTGAVTSGARRIYDVLPDGRFVGLITPGSTAPVGAARQIHVVLNWFDELKRLVPVN